MSAARLQPVVLAGCGTHSTGCCSKFRPQPRWRLIQANAAWHESAEATLRAALPVATGQVPGCQCEHGQSLNLVIFVWVRVAQRLVPLTSAVHVCARSRVPRATSPGPSSSCAACARPECLQELDRNSLTDTEAFLHIVRVPCHYCLASLRFAAVVGQRDPRWSKLRGQAHVTDCARRAAAEGS